MGGRSGFRFVLRGFIPLKLLFSVFFFSLPEVFFSDSEIDSGSDNSFWFGIFCFLVGAFMLRPG